MFSKTTKLNMGGGAYTEPKGCKKGLLNQYVFYGYIATY